MEVSSARQVLVNQSFRAPAEVVPLNHAQLAAEVSAVVKTVHTDVGSSVTAGSLLLELDPQDFLLALEQARATLAAAEAQKVQAEIRLQRARELSSNNYLAADDLLARETDLQVAQAQIRIQQVSVANAQRNVDKCRIVAPYDGIVTQRSAQVGAYVVPGSPLLELSQLGQAELSVAVPEELAHSLEQARQLEFVSRNERWPVRLLRMSGAIDTARRSREARLEFIADAPPSGRSGELLWTLDGGRVPAHLLVRRNNQLGIFVYQQGAARFRPLAGAEEGRPADADLPPDTQIITTGRDRLQDGDPVSLSN